MASVWPIQASSTKFFTPLMVCTTMLGRNSRGLGRIPALKKDVIKLTEDQRQQLLHLISSCFLVSLLLLGRDDNGFPCAFYYSNQLFLLR